MTSEDVIHDVFVPAFRIKADVLPGRYTQLWFQATRSGRYQLFCAEYCGTQHSGMIGEVIVDGSARLPNLAGGRRSRRVARLGRREAVRGPGCNTCHRADSRGRGPVLQGMFGTDRQLQGGRPSSPTRPMCASRS